MGSVDASTAAQLLEQYMPIAGALRWLWPYADADELLSAAREAILEAYVTHKPERANLTTWTRRTIYWRMSARAGEHFDNPADIPVERSTDKVVNGANPEEQFWRATAVHALAKLDLRKQVLVSARLKGETFIEAGATVGISGPMAHRELGEAFAQLREILDDMQRDEVD
jgi:DNA-directed RNA polymerase specialized sigma24 family protein